MPKSNSSAMTAPYSIGVDIGGTHITSAIVDLCEGRLFPESLSRATYSHESAIDIILHAWAKALNATLLKVAENELAGIGFAIPGPFDYRNGISKMEHKFKNLYGIHIPTALNPLLITQKDLPMRFLNDASSFAVGEAWQGAGKGYDKVVTITLGTGFGSAFTKAGVPVVSGPEVPKEGCLWHLPFKNGIADDYFSTRWFIEEYKKQTGQSVPGVKTLIEKADEDGATRALFEEFGQNLADCLAEPLRNFGAELLIMGGNISHALPLFGTSFEQGLKKAGMPVKVLVSKHSEQAALIGSARLMDNTFWEKVALELPNI